MGLFFQWPFSGETWQEDFSRAAPTVYRQAGIVLRGERDYEEAVQCCVLLMMDRFRKRWGPGGFLRVEWRHVVGHYRAGKRYPSRGPIGHRHERSAPVRLIDGEQLGRIAMHGPDRVSVLAWREFLASVSARCRIALQHVVSGSGIAHAARTARASQNTVKAWAVRALTELKG